MFLIVLQWISLKLTEALPASIFSWSVVFKAMITKIFTSSFFQYFFFNLNIAKITTENQSHFENSQNKKHFLQSNSTYTYINLHYIIAYLVFPLFSPKVWPSRSCRGVSRVHGGGGVIYGLFREATLFLVVELSYRTIILPLFLKHNPPPPQTPSLAKLFETVISLVP